MSLPEASNEASHNQLMPNSLSSLVPPSWPRRACPSLLYLLYGQNPLGGGALVGASGEEPLGMGSCSVTAIPSWSMTVCVFKPLMCLCLAWSIEFLCVAALSCTEPLYRTEPLFIVLFSSCFCPGVFGFYLCLILPVNWSPNPRLFLDFDIAIRLGSVCLTFKKAFNCNCICQQKKSANTSYYIYNTNHSSECPIGWIPNGWLWTEAAWWSSYRFILNNFHQQQKKWSLIVNSLSCFK